MAHIHERQIYKDVGGSNDKDVPWFTKDVDDSNIGKAARDLLQTYSGIPAEQVLPHVLAIRDRAWSIHPYPCIGQLRFLDLSVTIHPLFNTLISRLQGSETLLDLGCCFGQDIRALIAAGAPTSNLYGADLRPEYTDLGYELFKDKDRIEAKFFSGDVFSDWDRDEEKAFAKLKGNVDIIHAASLFHLFSLEDEKRLAYKLITLMRPVPGSLILGRQAGNVVAGQMASRSDSSIMVFRHNEDSWRELWQDVGRETGTRWKAESTFKEVEGWSRGMGKAEGRGEGDRMMTFSVERI